MTDPAVAHAFLVSEVEALEPFGFVVVVPDGHNLHVAEIVRCEDSGLEVRIPGRPSFLPGLDEAVRSALADRGFAAEEPSRSVDPWVRAAEDAGAAVDLLQEVLVEVFGEKPDAVLDVAHGSHRSEHEARQKLERARARIEPIAEELLGSPPERDPDGDYVLPIGEVHVMVAPRATPDAQIVIRVIAITNVGVDVTPDLGLFLARLNFSLMFGRFALDVEHRAIWFDESLLGEEFREEELRFAIRMVSSTADGWDDRLKEMFGGATYQEVLTGRAAQERPTTKPGEGTGMYL